ncbi:MAG TPA: glycosyltransferase [Gemmatimonadaceae bacterium]|nr:glycosyltransferase [Gemmatimonadaceae bacterium]
MSRNGRLRPLVLISSLAPGGAERVTVSCLRRMAQAGHPVPLCTVSSRGDGALAWELDRAGVARHDLGARRLADPRALMGLIRLLRRERYDLVHAHGQDAAVLAALACRLLGIPLVITRHVIEEPRDGWRRRLRATATTAALRRADALVAVSSATAKALQRTMGIPPGRVRVILNGIELERFAAAASHTDRNRARAALGLGRADRVVLVPAVLREGKGHDVLLSAMDRIRAHVPRVRVLFAGTGPLAVELQERARAHGEAVRFLGHRDDVPALMRAADLIVLPSLGEALPTALIEAAAAGRAVVSTRVGGVEEVVTHGCTGLLVPPGDPDALAAAVEELLQDHERARAFGAAARAMANERFGIDAQIARTWALWESAVARGPQ